MFVSIFHWQRLLEAWLIGLRRTTATQATYPINHLTLLSVGHRNGVARSRLPRKISRESRIGLTIQLRALVMSLAFVTSPMSIFLCLFPFVYSPRPHKCVHCLWKLGKFQKAVLCKVNKDVYQFSHVNSLCFPLLLRFWHIFIFISTSVDSVFHDLRCHLLSLFLSYSLMFKQKVNASKNTQSYLERYFTWKDGWMDR